MSGSDVARGAKAAGPGRIKPPSGGRKDAPAQPRGRFLLEQAKGHSPTDRLEVVVLGAATDVASALLLDPSWADRVVIVAMGFGCREVGRLERQRTTHTPGGRSWNRVYRSWSGIRL